MNQRDYLMEAMDAVFQQLTEGRDKYEQGEVGKAYLDWGTRIKTYQNCNSKSIADEIATACIANGFYVTAQIFNVGKPHPCEPMKEVICCYRISFESETYSGKHNAEDYMRFYPHYDERLDDCLQEARKKIREYQEKKAAEYRAEKEAKIAKAKKRIEDNRKSKTIDDKYVYVVSCQIKHITYRSYFKGETDLTKIVGRKWDTNFMTDKEKDAKVFQTKADAQELVDKLNKCWIIAYILRDMKVVRKSRKLYSL